MNNIYSLFYHLTENRYVFVTELDSVCVYVYAYSRSRFEIPSDLK